MVRYVPKAKPGAGTRHGRLAWYEPRRPEWEQARLEVEIWRREKEIQRLKDANRKLRNTERLNRAATKDGKLPPAADRPPSLQPDSDAGGQEAGL